LKHFANKPNNIFKKLEISILDITLKLSAQIDQLQWNVGIFFCRGFICLNQLEY